MAMKLSTGLRNQLLASNPFRTIFNLSFLSIYSNSGALPPTADDALVGGTHVLLCRISNNNTTTGLTFASSASSGIITKTLAETWSKAAVSGGTAAFFRLEASGDTGVLSTTEARLQGICALAGGELLLPTLTLVSSTVYTVDNFSWSLPTL